MPTATETVTATVIPTATPIATVTADPTATATSTPSTTATVTPAATPTPIDLTRLGSIIALVTSPLGSGSRDLEIVRDGDKPSPGTSASTRQYDTWDGANPASEDWIGYAYATPRTFVRVVFQEGMHFWDGGWFETLTVQALQSGSWVAVSGLTVSPAYPAIDDGVSFQTYTLDFVPITGDAIRLHGRPGGGADFVSVGELEVFGE